MKSQISNRPVFAGRMRGSKVAYRPPNSSLCGKRNRPAFAGRVSPGVGQEILLDARPWGHTSRRHSVLPRVLMSNLVPAYSRALSTVGEQHTVASSASSPAESCRQKAAAYTSVSDLPLRQRTHRATGDQIIIRRSQGWCRHCLLATREIRCPLRYPIGEGCP